MPGLSKKKTVLQTAHLHWEVIFKIGPRHSNLPQLAVFACCCEISKGERMKPRSAYGCAN